MTGDDDQQEDRLPVPSADEVEAFREFLTKDAERIDGHAFADLLRAADGRLARATACDAYLDIVGCLSFRSSEPAALDRVPVLTFGVGDGGFLFRADAQWVRLPWGESFESEAPAPRVIVEVFPAGWSIGDLRAVEAERDRVAREGAA